MRKRACCLYRASTKEQVEKDDIPMQKQRCHEFTSQKDWDIVQEFSEKGVSGFKVSAKDRDAIQEIQRDDKRIGWSITEPTDGLIGFFVAQGWDDIMMNRQEGFSIRGIGGPGARGGITPPATGRTSSTRKVACPCCGQSVRATKKVNILCGDCMVPMVEV